MLHGNSHRLRSVGPLLMLCVCAFLLVPLTGVAVERFPPPDFQSGYQLPVTYQTPPKADWREWLDVAGLCGLLVAATWFALKRRSRAGLFGVGLVSVAWFGFWRAGCVCPIGAIQNVALGLADARFAVPVTVIVILLVPLAMTLLFGRTYCAAVCPHGALQDLVLLYPLRLPRWLSTALGLLPHLYLGLAVLFAVTGSAFVICRFDPFVGIFRLDGPRDMILMGALFLFAAVFIGRPYCRFACPLGALFGWMSRLSWQHATITPDRCIHCRLCEDVCPFDAIRQPVPDDLARDRRTGLGRLAAVLILCPLLVAGGSWLGVRLSPFLARVNTQVQLAEALAGQGVPTLEVTTYQAAGGMVEDANRAADAVRRSFRLGGGLLGAYLGIVAAGVLVRLSIRRAQPDYHMDRAECFSCGRCFMACPREWARQGRLGDPPAAPGGDNAQTS